MQQMKAFYAPRKNLRVEARGQRFQLGDFIIKIGSVVLSQVTSFRGVLIEVGTSSQYLLFSTLVICFENFTASDGGKWSLQNKTGQT